MFARSAIIYQQPSKTVTLLDIPLSIALAQGTANASRLSLIYSMPALEEPWPSTEPKSMKAKANVAAHGMNGENDVEEREFIHTALIELHEIWKGEWCLDRRINADLPEPFIQPMPSRSDTPKEGHRSEPLVLRAPRELPMQCSDLHLWPVHNLTGDTISLPVEVIFDPQTPTGSRQLSTTGYYIPPSSTFILSEVNNWSSSIAFGMGVFSLIPDHSISTFAGAGEFDLVLLDPPWPNRSARRSKVYNTTSSPLDSLQTTLSNHIAPSGIVTCWITNSASTRTKALECFKAWNLQLIEEWFWLKVTKHGQPVTDLHGLWRKPYETLLIAQKIPQPPLDDSPSSFTTYTKPQTRKRVIIAVPDLHSRKPCLKSLLEEAFGLREGEYRALEVFARGLVAGWWSWGNECLKFQWKGWWSEEGDFQSR